MRYFATFELPLLALDILHRIIVNMADTEEQIGAKREYNRFPEEFREKGAEAVYRALSPEQQRVAREQGAAAVSFEVTASGPKCQKRSPLTDALADMILTCRGFKDSVWAGGSEEVARAARENLGRWFRLLDIPNEQPDAQKRSAKDAQRRPNVGEELDEAEWDAAVSCLVSETWRDGHGNMRRFSGLQDAAEYWRIQYNKTGSNECLEKYKNLKRIKDKSKADGWKHLEDAVVKRFDLRQVKEVIRNKRDFQKSQTCAQRLLGLLPMVETFAHKGQKSAQESRRKHKELLLVTEQEKAQATAQKRRPRGKQIKFKSTFFQVLSHCLRM